MHSGFSDCSTYSGRYSRTEFLGHGRSANHLHQCGYLGLGQPSSDGCRWNEFANPIIGRVGQDGGINGCRNCDSVNSLLREYGIQICSYWNRMRT